MGTGSFLLAGIRAATGVCAGARRSLPAILIPPRVVCIDNVVRGMVFGLLAVVWVARDAWDVLGGVFAPRTFGVY